MLDFSLPLGAFVLFALPLGALVDLAEPDGAFVDLAEPDGALVDLALPLGALVDLADPDGALVLLAEPSAFDDFACRNLSSNCNQKKRVKSHNGMCERTKSISNIILLLII